MMTIDYMKEILNLNKHLIITFAGLPYKNTKRAVLYTYQGRFYLVDGRITTDNMLSYGKSYQKKRQYSRSIKKIIMIKKGDQLLYGKRCLKCGKAMPRSHGNCFSCYSSRLEQRYEQTLP